MNDNPFSEPDDSERTILRGGRMGAAPPPPPAADSPTILRHPAPAMPQAPLGGEADALPKVGRSPLLAAAAPLLDLLGRLGRSAQGAPGGTLGRAEDVQQRAMQALATFEADCRAAGIGDEALRAAHYTLCAALDDTALATPWGQNSQWAARSLSSVFHQDVRSGDRVFDLLAGMQKEPGRYHDALELAYLCLALGLRGRYRLDPRGGAELERIRESLSQLLDRINGAWERDLSPHWKGLSAPHRSPVADVPAWVWPLVALSLLALGYVAAAYHLGGRSDALQQQLTQLPPAKPPAIVRVQAPVAPAMPQAAPAAVDKVRKFLAAEIAEGLVAVDGDVQTLRVRISGKGMFAPGSATLEPRYVQVLQRVGDALKAEPGRVAVLGHSDNTPIRTLRFPSNFQLSAARAESAMAVLEARAGGPERFTSAGRADTEPLDSNDTPEGRDRNRRIEVVLSLASGR